MKVLVTGGTGFLGRHLATRLLREGMSVTIQGRNPQIGATLEAMGMTFAPQNLEDCAGMEQLCENQDLVFHSAALSSPWGSYRNFFAANVLGTRHVISGCQKHNVRRLIHVSTPGIYFNFRNRRNIRESDPLPAKPVNHYAATKLLAEKEIDMAHSNGLPVITLRPRAIFGPYDNAIMPRIFRIAAKRPIPMIRDGAAVIDVTCVHNVVEALMRCIDAPAGCLGKKYNITNGEPMPLRSLLEMVFEALKRPFVSRATRYGMAYTVAFVMEGLAHLTPGFEPPLTRYGIGLMAKDQTLDIHAAQQELGYKPIISIREGINEYATWWLSNQNR